MKRKLVTFLGTLCSSAIGLSVVYSNVAHAAFNANRIIDNVIFDNATSMNVNDIDSFLNSLPSSCISKNKGFSATDVTGYTPTAGFTYGGLVSAGKVISHAAQAYNISPKVLLTTLQKEQSLVTGSAGCSTLAYAAATGYGCPDGGTTHSYSNVNLYAINGTMVTSVTGTCVNSAQKVGFSQQVIHAAWLLKFGEQRSQGNINWAVIMDTSTDSSGNAWASHWDNSDDPQTCYGGPMTQGAWQVCPSGATTYYDGYTTIDSTAVHMDTGATASLYWYTPHLSGNQNFETIYTGWFGTTVTSGFSWQFINQFAYTDSSKSTLINTYQLVAGQRYFLTVRVKNIDTQTWYKNNVFLGTWNAKDRASIFKDWTWPSTRNNRAGTLVEDTVAPGEYGDFEFWIQAPSTTGVYREYLNLVDEGITWMNDTGLNFQLQVNPRQYSWQYVSQYAWTDNSKTTLQNTFQLTHGQRYYMTMIAKNTGNVPWYRGQVNLATWQPQDHPSPVKDWTWPSTQNNRPGYFNEDVVQPGQTANYDFWVLAPVKPGTYWEHYNLVAEGITWMNDNGLYFGYASN